MELNLRYEFDSVERNLARRAFEQLIDAGYIEPTLTDLNEPENWVRISEAGIAALERNIFDDLDEALQSLNPQLLERRRELYRVRACPREKMHHRLHRWVMQHKPLISQNLT